MTAPIPSQDASIDPTESARRLRIVACRTERVTGGNSAVTVEFSVPGSEDTFASRAMGTASPSGDLRLAAVATVSAVTRATNGGFTAEVIGAKSLRAFDATIVVVALLADVEGATRHLVGASVVQDDLGSSVALATLHAVNRLVAPLLTTPDQ